MSSSEDENDYESAEEESVEEQSEEEEEEEEEEEPVKKRKAKKFKDPNKPKRNMSAFFLFSQAMRSQVKEDNPGIPFGEIVSDCMPGVCLYDVVVGCLVKGSNVQV